MDHNKRIVTGNNSKIPALSEVLQLNVYISSHHAHGLPKHIEQVVRADLDLEILTTLVDNDLHLTRPGRKLSINVVDFLISRQKSHLWH